MRGEASLASEKRIRDAFADELRAQGSDGVTLAKELLDVTALLEDQARLQKAFTDPGRTDDEKIALVRDIFSGKVQPITLRIIEDLVRQRWSRPVHIANSLEDLAVDAVISATEAQGVTSRVSVELCRVQSSLLDQPQVLAGLSDTRASSDARKRLLQTVIRVDELHPLTVFLIDHVAHQPRRRRFSSTLTWLVGRISEHEGEQVITITTAIAIGEEQRQRIQDAYTRQLGKKVYVNCIVDPRVLGGMRIQNGQDISGNTVAAQLQTLHRAIATTFLTNRVAYQPPRRSFTSNMTWLVESISGNDDERKIIVTTAVELEDDRKKRIEEAYAKKLGKALPFEYVVDPKVLGGIRIQNGADITDNTVVAQLHSLNRTLV